MLPVDVFGVVPVHLVDPGELLILEILDLGIDIGIAPHRQRPTVIHISIVNLLVSRVALQKSRPPILLDHIDSGIGVDVEAIPAGLADFLDVVAVGELGLGGLQANGVVGVDGV